MSACYGRKWLLSSMFSRILRATSTSLKFWSESSRITAGSMVRTTPSISGLNLLISILHRIYSAASIRSFQLFSFLRLYSNFLLKSSVSGRGSAAGGDYGLRGRRLRRIFSMRLNYCSMEECWRGGEGEGS